MQAGWIHDVPSRAADVPAVRAALQAGLPSVARDKHDDRTPGGVKFHIARAVQLARAFEKMPWVVMFVPPSFPLTTRKLVESVVLLRAYHPVELPLQLTVVTGWLDALLVQAMVWPVADPVDVQSKF